MNDGVRPKDLVLKVNDVVEITSPQVGMLRSGWSRHEHDWIKVQIRHDVVPRTPGPVRRSVMPGGFSLYARIAEAAGFESFFVGGSRTSAFLYGVPDWARSDCATGVAPGSSPRKNARRRRHWRLPFRPRARPDPCCHQNWQSAGTRAPWTGTRSRRCGSMRPCRPGAQSHRAAVCEVPDTVLDLVGDTHREIPTEERLSLTDV